MADTPSSRSATVPSLPKSFPPGGLTLATLAFPSREAAAAAADSVAAAHGYPQAFDGLEPPASVYDSAPGLSPELGGPADGPPINPATASPATKVALGLSSGEGTRLASVFAAEAPPPTPWRHDPGGPRSGGGGGSSSSVLPRPRAAPRSPLPRGASGGGADKSDKAKPRTDVPPAPPPFDDKALAAETTRVAIARAVKTTTAQVHALFPNLAALVAAAPGGAGKEVPTGVQVSFSIWQVEQYFGFLAIQASVALHAPALGSLGARLLSIFATPKSFDVRAASLARRALTADGGPSPLARVMGCVPVGTLALLVLLAEGPPPDGGDASALLTACKKLSLSDAHGNLDFSGIDDIALALDDAVRRQIELPLAELFHALAGAAIAASDNTFSGRSKDNEPLVWSHFAAELDAGTTYERSRHIAPSLAHIQWLLDEYSKFSWAVANSERSRQAARTGRVLSSPGPGTVLAVGPMPTSAAAPTAMVTPPMSAADQMLERLGALVDNALKLQLHGLQQQQQAGNNAVVLAASSPPPRPPPPPKPRGIQLSSCWFSPCPGRVGAQYVACDICKRLNPRLEVCTICNKDAKIGPPGSPSHCTSSGCVLRNATTSLRPFDSSTDARLLASITQAGGRNWATTRAARDAQSIFHATHATVPTPADATPAVALSPGPTELGAGEITVAVLAAGTASLLARSDLVALGCGAILFNDGLFALPGGQHYVTMSRDPESGLPSIPGQLVPDADGRVTFCVGLPPGAGEPFSVLFDSCAQTSIFRQADARALWSVSTSPGTPIQGILPGVAQSKPGKFRARFFATASRHVPTAPSLLAAIYGFEITPPAPASPHPLGPPARAFRVAALPPAAACLLEHADESLPPTPPSQPARLASLFDATEPRSPMLTLVRHSPLTGLPAGLVELEMAEDEFGTPLMLSTASTTVPPAPILPPASRGLEPEPEPAFDPAPLDARSPALKPLILRWALSGIRTLPPSTRIQYGPNPKVPGSASYARYASRQKYTTLGQLGPLVGTVWNDVKYEAARGHLMFARGALAPPAKALATRSPPSPMASSLAAAEDWDAARVGSHLSSTLAEIARLESLEEGGRATSPTENGDAVVRALLREYEAASDSATEETVRKAIALDYGSTDPAFTIGPASAAVFAARFADTAASQDLAATLPTSVTDALSRPDNEMWRRALKREFERVDRFKAFRLVSSAERDLIAASPETTSVAYAYMVVAFKIKSDPTGERLVDPHRTRFTVADPGGGTDGLHVYAGCVGAATGRAATQLGLNRNAIFDSVDNEAAYFKAPKSKGREVFVRVAPWMEPYGFPQFDAVTGKRNFIHLLGNVPGLCDAAVSWQLRLHGFYRDSMKMTQAAYDPQLFTLDDAGDQLALWTHVDDTRFFATAQRLRRHFLLKWATEFDEELEPGALDEHVIPSSLCEDFTGLRFHRVNETTIEITCIGAIKALEQLLQDHPLPAGMHASCPLSPESLTALSSEELETALAADDPILHVARRLGGVSAFVVTTVRADSYTGFSIIARNLNPQRLTTTTWRELLRLCHYLVATIDMPLTLRKSSGQLIGYVDSSLCNLRGSRSLGGHVLLEPGSGAILWRCAPSPKTFDASGAAELFQASRATKDVVGMRLLYRELGAAQATPTPIRTDAKVLIDGARCQKVSQESKWVATRYAMVREAQEDGSLVLVQWPSAENAADLFTKPLTGEAFARHRALVLGLRG